MSSSGDEAFLDAVDDGQLGGALVGFREERFVSSNRRAFSSATLRLDASVDEQPHVGISEGVVPVEVLERDDAGRDLAADDEGHERRATSAARPGPARTVAS